MNNIVYKLKLEKENSLMYFKKNKKQKKLSELMTEIMHTETVTILIIGTNIIDTGHIVKFNLMQVVECSY